MPSDYYCQINGQTLGPVSAKHLRYLALYGNLSPADLVRKDGSDQWVPAGSYADLFPEAGPAQSAPPPQSLQRAPAPRRPPQRAGPSFSWQDVVQRTSARFRRRDASLDPGGLPPYAFYGVIGGMV